jgi:hypothetical protein
LGESGFQARLSKKFMTSHLNRKVAVIPATAVSIKRRMWSRLVWAKKQDPISRITRAKGQEG